MDELLLLYSNQLTSLETGGGLNKIIAAHSKQLHSYNKKSDEVYQKKINFQSQDVERYFNKHRNTFSSPFFIRMTKKLGLSDYVGIGAQQKLNLLIRQNLRHPYAYAIALNQYLKDRKVALKNYNQWQGQYNREQDHKAASYKLLFHFQHFLTGASLEQTFSIIHSISKWTEKYFKEETQLLLLDQKQGFLLLETGKKSFENLNLLYQMLEEVVIASNKIDYMDSHFDKVENDISDSKLIIDFQIQYMRRKISSINKSFIPKRKSKKPVKKKHRILQKKLVRQLFFQLVNRTEMEFLSN